MKATGAVRRTRHARCGERPSPVNEAGQAAKATRLSCGSVADGEEFAAALVAQAVAVERD
jgi:hypothetical protein